MLLAAAIFCAACDERAPDMRQQLRIAIEGGGRNVDARFEYVCRMTDAAPGGGARAYRPAGSSFLYRAPNGQGLLIGSSNVQSDGLCVNDPRQLEDPKWQTMPSLVWLDNVERPQQLDIVNSASVALARQPHFLPELKEFEVRTEKAPPDVPPLRQRQQVFVETLSALDRSEYAGAVRMLSPAHLYIAIDAPSAHAAEEIRAALGPSGSAKVVQLDICRLLRFRDGRAYFESRYPAVAERCPAKDRGTMSSARLKIANAQGLKRLSGSVWARTDSPTEVESYLRDDASAVSQPGAARSEAIANSPTFWQRNVTAVRWTTPRGGFDLPARPETAFYAPAEKAIVVFLGDVRTVRFPGFKSWRKL